MILGFQSVNDNWVPAREGRNGSIHFCLSLAEACLHQATPPGTRHPSFLLFQVVPSPVIFEIPSHCLIVETVTLQARLHNCACLGAIPVRGVWLRPLRGRASWKRSSMSWKWHKLWTNNVGTLTGMRGLKLMLCGYYAMSIYCSLNVVQ